jgi:hypothetical protein
VAFFVSRHRRKIGEVRVVTSSLPVSKKQTTKFRRLIRCRCRYCGRDFFADKQAGRPPLFCGKKCRQAEFRFISGLRRSGFEPEATTVSIRDETPQKTEVNSKISKVSTGDRPSPLEVLGHGYRWPNGAAIDRETLAEIIAMEIPGAQIRPRRPSIKQGVLDLAIADDLSIPDFLQRRP